MDRSSNEDFDMGGLATMVEASIVDDGFISSIGVGGNWCCCWVVGVGVGVMMNVVDMLLHGRGRRTACMICDGIGICRESNLKAKI